MTIDIPHFVICLELDSEEMFVSTKADGSFVLTPDSRRTTPIPMERLGDIVAHLASNAQVDYICINRSIERIRHAHDRQRLPRR